MLVADEWADYIRALVDDAPPLTQDQIDVLAVLLNPAPVESPDEATA